MRHATKIYNWLTRTAKRKMCLFFRCFKRLAYDWTERILNLESMGWESICIHKFVRGELALTRLGNCSSHAASLVSLAAIAAIFRPRLTRFVKFPFIPAILVNHWDSFPLRQDFVFAFALLDGAMGNLSSHETAEALREYRNPYNFESYDDWIAPISNDGK